MQATHRCAAVCACAAVCDNSHKQGVVNARLSASNDASALYEKAILLERQRLAIHSERHCTIQGNLGTVLMQMSTVSEA